MIYRKVVAVSPRARKVALAAGLITLAFVGGNMSGWYFYPRLFTNVRQVDEEQVEEHTHDDEHEHVALTLQAFENLEMRLGRVKRSSYWKSLTVPGEVIEIPGKSDISVSAPVSGVVESVMVLEGQALEPAERLFVLRITDDKLVGAQSELLKTLSRQAVVKKEIDRISPLADSGTIAGRRLLELKYEQDQLDLTRETLSQEIRALGLPESMLTDVIEDKKLASKLTVSVPAQIDMSHPPMGESESTSIPSRYRDLTLEGLQVHPGQSVQRGDALCGIACHAELYVRGQAFEADVQTLRNAADKGWKIYVDIGHDHGDPNQHFESIGGLRLLHVDNHVDSETQTFRFYLPVRNEVEMFTTDAHGRRFQQWRLRPGQRVHIRIPTNHWEEMIVLPLDAVVVEGPNAYVFVEHIEEPVSAVEEDPDHEDIFIEFERVPVRLLHRGAREAVVEFADELCPEERVALNCAYKLHLAMKMQASSGGGHHHHDH